MKTAVSIPEPLFKAGEKFAKKRRMSRSALYARALEELLTRQSDDEVTRRLDEVYAEESSDLDPLLGDAQSRVLRRTTWKK